jgi:predicted Zn-dependent protease
MTGDERQFLMTATWMFMRHGQRPRALAVCEALVEEDPRDGVSAMALAELLLGEGDATRAIDVLHVADIPPSLAHAAAVLETRALQTLGRNGDAVARWNRYLASRKGASRDWLAG